MLNTDGRLQNVEPQQPNAVQGFSTISHEIKSLLGDLAHDIEQTRRKHQDALALLSSRLDTLDQGPRNGATGADAGGWDAASAEALTNAYEDYLHTPQSAYQPAYRGPPLDTRFDDLTQQIEIALAGKERPHWISRIEDRLDQFQSGMAAALDDVVRRSDLDGMHLIEAHVGDLTSRLETVQAQVSRLHDLESDITHVVRQLSDERLAQIVGQNNGRSDDLESLAIMAAEQAQRRLMADFQAQRETDAQRLDDLRAVLDRAIQDWRHSEVKANSLVQGLSGAVSEQVQRYDELRSMLETSAAERRKSEDQSVQSFDMVQQALVRLLDRMDSIETKMAAPAPAAQPRHDGLAASAEQARDAAARNAQAARAPAEPAGQSAAYPQVQVQAPVQSPAQATAGSPRRNLAAEAQRAKSNAAASRAQALGVSDGATAFKGGPSQQAGAGRKEKADDGKLVSSPRLIAAALALVVALNGAILLFSKKPDVVPIAVIPMDQPVAQSPASDGMPRTPAAPESAPAATDGALKPRSEVQPAQGSFAMPNSPEQQVDAAPTADRLDLPPMQSFGWNSDGNPNGLMGDGASEPSAATAAAAFERARSADAEPRVPTTINAALSQDEQAGATSAAAPVSPASLKMQDLPPATVGPLSLRRAAAQGDASAQFEVGSRLAEGKGTQQDLKEAVRWYQRSAAQGFAMAQYRLGTMIERGLGAEKDGARARDWYQRAAEQGSVKAMHNLAVLIAGNATPDYEEAARWFTQAAERGLADSQYNLGVLYENGLGVKQDKFAAYKWYALAAKGGDKDAETHRSELSASLSAKERKDAEGLVERFKMTASDHLANDPKVAGEDWKKRSESAAN